jgi:hypothetical protein
MRTSIAAGAFFIIVGVVFLLDAAGLWTVPSGYLIPAFVIALGIALLVGGVADRT